MLGLAMPTNRGAIAEQDCELRPRGVPHDRLGTLFMAGDAAHIVPPAGVRGLNSAASDIYYLYHALVDHYTKREDAGLESYSRPALARVWKGQRFFWWMTTLLHRFSDSSNFDRRLQDTEARVSVLLAQAPRLAR